MNRVITRYEYVLNFDNEEDKKSVTVKQHDIVKIWGAGNDLVEIKGRISQLSDDFIIVDSSTLYHKSETRVSIQQIVDMEVIDDVGI